MSDSESEDYNYRIRFSETANNEALAAAASLAELTGDQERAKIWHSDLKTEIGTLASNPRRYPILPRESRILRTEIRRYLFRKSRHGIAYHAYYVIEDSGDDGPTVTVFHVRHASRRPITSAEAKYILGAR